MRPPIPAAAFAPLCALFLGHSPAGAESRTSADYNLTIETGDSAGGKISSAAYTLDTSMGMVGAIANAASAPFLSKVGYVDQICDPSGIGVSASPASLDEGGCRQLGATQLLDDDTLLPLDPSAVTWSVASGPIASITPGGLATAGNVHHDSPARVRGSAEGFSDILDLTVLNTGSDDCGLYAADGIDDDWQVRHFGEENPQAMPDCDPDGDGQDNHFEFLALVVPTDNSSRFALDIRPAPGQPGKVDLILEPVSTERTYTILWSADLTPGSWHALTGASQDDIGDQRIITDGQTGPARKFYRVQIGR